MPALEPLAPHEVIQPFPRKGAFKTHDIIRLPLWKGQDEGKAQLVGWRVWRIAGCYYSVVGGEDYYEMICLDKGNSKTLRIPCVVLETHPHLEVKP